jgi:hypothetical protein
VDQILSPYCTLYYIPDDTELMGDLTTFTCIARTEQSILLPIDIIVKFDDAAADALIYLGQETTTFFGGYPVEVQYKGSKSQRLIMQQYEEPAECFISHILLNSMLIDKFSTMVILLPRQGSSLMVQKT